MTEWWRGKRDIEVDRVRGTYLLGVISALLALKIGHFLDNMPKDVQFFVDFVVLTWLANAVLMVYAYTSHGRLYKSDSVYRRADAVLYLSFAVTILLGGMAFIASIIHPLIVRMIPISLEDVSLLVMVAVIIGLIWYARRHPDKKKSARP